MCYYILSVPLFAFDERGKIQKFAGVDVTAIVDYKSGNVGSILNMFKKIGAHSELSSDEKTLLSADRLLLPGVGAFDSCAQALRESGLADTVREFAQSGKPLLGICVGMQLLGRGSEEGELEGLGLLPFECRRFRFDDPTLKIPHMGWDRVDLLDPTAALVRGFESPARFYFVHSYHAVCDLRSDVLMSCDYDRPFDAAVHRANIWGTQFHPEKSHRFGMKLLENFVKEC